MPSKKPSFATALRSARAARGLSQEALGELSSRTYVSTLERGLKSPTLHKVEQFASMLDLHPLTLLVMTYVNAMSEADVERVLAHVKAEIQSVRGSAGQ